MVSERMTTLVEQLIQNIALAWDPTEASGLHLVH
jgi:hypothetical protein